MKIITSQMINSWLINLPSIKHQQQIIDIIEPKEKLFLKYHNIIDISNIDDFKKT